MQIITKLNLSNVVDELAAIKSEISDLMQQEKQLKDLLIETGAGTIDGTLHRCAISYQDGKKTIDWASIAAKFNPSRQLITANTSTGLPFYSVRISARKTSK